MTKKAIYSRRQLLKAGATLINCLGFAPSFLNALEKKESGHQRLTFYVCGDRGEETNISFLHSIDVESGTTKKFSLPMAKAHEVIKIDANRVLVAPLEGQTAVVLNIATGVVEKTIAPSDKNLFFSGHTAIIGNELFLSESAKFFKDAPGGVSVFDKSTLKLKRSSLVNGVYPHQIVAWGSDEVALSVMSVTKPAFFNKHELYHLYKPKVIILNKLTLKPTWETHLPDIVTAGHFDIARGQVFIVGVQYLKDNQGSIEWLKSKRHIDLSHIKRNIFEKEKKRLGLPSPLRVVNIKSKAVQTFMPQPMQQRRSQTVLYHPLLDKVFVSFSFSNSIGVIDTKTHNMHYIDLKAHGVTEVRGLALVPESRYLAVSDYKRGISLIDVEQNKTIRKFDVETFSCFHLHCNTSAGIAPISPEINNSSLKV